MNEQTNERKNDYADAAAAAAAADDDNGDNDDDDDDDADDDNNNNDDGNVDVNLDIYIYCIYLYDSTIYYIHTCTCIHTRSYTYIIYFIIFDDCSQCIVSDDQDMCDSKMVS